MAKALQVSLDTLVGNLLESLDIEKVNTVEEIKNANCLLNLF
ncbi:hypothetical protein [Absiella sp. AM29-15]|nr:hypothetical protein [Absiella sp. AM29-15]